MKSHDFNERKNFTLTDVYIRQDKWKSSVKDCAYDLALKDFSIFVHMIFLIALI